ncbi:MAG: beta-galactosidase [Alphaproteobacteria bacterium]|nr:beta-galactosidase [Alphaproteobacteria bacterium]
MTAAPYLGICYYPEQWPESQWRDDARRMAEIGVREVRIAEFSWARIEPSRGEFQWDWLDRAIDTLTSASLRVMLCTPTATPPKWLVDEAPEILAWDRHGRPRRFGSRRHYCFSSPRYRNETVRIVTAIAERYGQLDAITAWQTDNEYGCHNTTRSYSPAAATAFRDWLSNRYGTASALNEAWGTTFWSQSYRSFTEVDLPNLLVTEANPSHLLDFYRFSSDQVISFNRLQADILRRLSPGRPIVHNAMGFYFEFDHYQLGLDLDAIGWDSYPLGFLDLAELPTHIKRRYMRQGHPDFAGFHHDLYRRCGRGRWRVSEQQPGPVNWAPHNPAPLPGMVRLWGVEAAAHAAEAVSYFRWRQVPFGQEQMHAGLLTPANEPAPGFGEARCAAADFASIEARAVEAKVALVHSYEAHWVFEAERQSAGWSYPALLLEWYNAARRLAVDIDIVAPGDDLSKYSVVLCPSLPIISEDAIGAFAATTAALLFGPRTGAKTSVFHIPDEMPPGPLQDLIPIRVVRCESFPEYYVATGQWEGQDVGCRIWLDHVESEIKPIAQTADGVGLLYEHGRVHYLAGAPEPAFLASLIGRLVSKAGLRTVELPEDVRVRRSGELTFAFNYGPNDVTLPAELFAHDPEFISGGQTLSPASFSIWR